MRASPELYAARRRLNELGVSALNQIWLSGNVYAYFMNTPEKEGVEAQQFYLTAAYVDTFIGIPRMVVLRAEQNNRPLIHAETGPINRYILFHPRVLADSIYERSQMIDGNVSTKIRSSRGRTLGDFPMDLASIWKNYLNEFEEKKSPDLTTFFKK